MKKKTIFALAFLLAFLAGGIISYFVFGHRLAKLPKPERAEGFMGETFGVDKNINEESIDKYLDREDSVYRDMRMYVDEADYESIGGDSYLSGFVRGFAAVPFPLLVNVTGLPEEVGESYQGTTLFTHTEEGEYIANFEESMAYLEYHFPKDKYIFLMCGGAGYAGMMKDMLIDLGWDEDKIYNVGGYWFYEGENAISVKRTVNGQDHYDFWKIDYLGFDFADMQKVN